MSIEQTLERIAQSCERQERLLEELLSDLINNEKPAQLPTVEAVEAVEPAPPVESEQPIPVEPVSVEAVQPVPIEVVQPVPVPVPTVQPEPATTVAQLPFTDQQSLMKWTVNKYNEIGPTRGAALQGILAGLGVSNMSDVTPEHYQSFYAQVVLL